MRELFPAEEASWRIPTVMFPGALGMAASGWLAGVSFYAPAFAAGIGFNLAEHGGHRIAALRAAGEGHLPATAG